MSDKDLKDKAIDIKGKEYVLVSDRIIYFNEKYPEGCIKTKLITDPGADTVFVKAAVYPDSGKQLRYFTGYSQAKWGEGYINKTSALENAETSAVGRALAFMGIGVIDSVASLDEMNKTTHNQPVTPQKAETEVVQSPRSEIPATPKQIKMIHSLISQADELNPEKTKEEIEAELKKNRGIESFTTMPIGEAKKLIDAMLKALADKKLKTGQETVNPTEQKSIYQIR